MTDFSLPPRQARFVEGYLIDLNATQAAIRAGYSIRTAEVQGPRLLGIVRVREAICNAILDRARRAEINADWVLQKLKENVMSGLADRDRSAVNKALELIGRHLQMFPTTQSPGTSPATPMYFAEVGYDINELIKDPELKALIIQLDDRMKALSGGAGIIEG